MSYKPPERRLSDSEANAIELFEERAAVREFEGGIPRPNAESSALRDVKQALGIEAARAVQRYRERASVIGTNKELQ